MLTFIDSVYGITDRMYKPVYLIGALCLLLGTVSRVGVVSALAVGVLLMALCFHIGKAAYDDKAMVLLGVVSLCGHFFLAVCFNYLFPAFGTDSLEYHHRAAAMTESLHNGVPISAIPVFKQYFTYFVAVVYFLFGVNRLISTFIVSFFTVWAGVLTHLACKTAGMPKPAGYVASAAIWFMPGFLFFTSDLLKDSLMLFLIALAFYLFAGLVYESHAKWKTVLLVVAVVLSLAVSATIRFYMFIPVIAGFGLSLLVYFISKKGWRHRLTGAVLLVLFAALFVILSRRHISQWLVGIEKALAMANSSRQGAFAYDSAGIRGYDISTVAKALRALPVLCAHFLLQPFPTTWLASDGPFYIKLLMPDMLLWYVLLPLALLGGYVSVLKKNYLGIAALGFFIVFMVIDALLVGNVGALYRYRLQLQAVGFILTGLGVVQCGKSKKAYAVLVATGLGVCLLLNGYIGLRYADGTIDIAETPLTLTYQAAETGRHTLRYYVNSPKQTEESPPMAITVLNADTGETVNEVQYDEVARGYANLHFEAKADASFTITFQGREAAAVSDVKVMTPGGRVRVLAGSYPLLPQNVYAFSRQKGWLVSDTVDSRPKAKTEVYKAGLLPEEEWIVFGDAIRYKGVDVIPTADGGTRFDFILECVAEMENDFTLWMHIFPDDINLLGEGNRTRGYVHGDHGVTVPTGTWTPGETYIDSHTVYLPPGNWRPQFGFWKPPAEEQAQIRLNTPENQSGAYVGWIAVE